MLAIAHSLREWKEWKPPLVWKGQHKQLARVSLKGQKVCTTKQLAEFYGCSEENIQKNYERNIDRFVDGAHYFKLEGSELKRFRDLLPDNFGSQISTMVRALMV